MSQWSDTDFHRFHPEKGKYINIGRKKNIPYNQYIQGTTTLERIYLEKDIGLYIDDELKSEKHIDEKVKKASKMFAVVRRSFHHLNKNFIPLYKSLVRTHHDYASCIWSPMNMKLVKQIDGVQGHKQIPVMKDLSYTKRLRAIFTIFNIFI